MLAAWCVVFAPIAAPAQTVDKIADQPVMQTGPIVVPGSLDKLNIPTDQQQADKLQTTLDLLAQLPSATQARLLDEADRNRGYCRRNVTLNNFYDCSCFALRMLDSRIHKGPNVPMNNMIPGTDLSMCTDSAAAAGFFYKRCQGVLKMQNMASADEDALCACGARGAAIQWANDPTVSIRAAATSPRSPR